MSLKTKVKEIKEQKLTAVNNVLSFSKKIATQKTKDLNIFLNLNEEAIAQAKEIDKRIKEKKSTGKQTDGEREKERQKERNKERKKERKR